MDTDTILAAASRMMTLFEGFADAYGSYDAGGNETRGGKVEIKATARTVRQQVTRRLWDAHISGVEPLGIIPIRDNDTCLWGAIDVDQYDLNHLEVIERIAKQNFPLVTCRTKSGGLHLFLFLEDPAPAELVRARLKEMAAILSLGGSEVFPKQSHVNLVRGDLGNWLNMPYFEGNETSRYGIRRDGGSMDLEEFLDTAEDLRQPVSFLDRTHRKKPEGDLDFGDGPPCMQHIAAEGLPDTSHARNKGLFAFAIFARKKFGSRWEEKVEEWNRKYIQPPLPATEVMQIIKSHEKKDYNYPCREAPICAHCNSTLCRTRRFGVGGEDDFPVINSLRVVGKDPPLWFVDINDEQIELTTEELQTYRHFHKACMERLNICFRMMKSNDWIQVLSDAMKNIVRIDAPEEIGRTGEFYELMEDFLTNRHKAENKDEILLGKPWHDIDKGRYWFRLRDLHRYLENSGFKIYNRAQVTARIRHLGGERDFWNIRGVGTNVWWVPDVFKPMPKVPLPLVEREPI